MYQDSRNTPSRSGKRNEETNKRKRSRFAMLLEQALEVGEIVLPFRDLSAARSFRSSINRFRAEQRRKNSQFTESWDMISNRVREKEDGTAEVSIYYDKMFWDAVDEQLKLAEDMKKQIPPNPMRPGRELTKDRIGVVDPIAELYGE